MYPDAEARLGPEWGGESVVEGAWDIRVTRAIWILSLALVLYDYVLTFGDEVNWMWNGKFLWTRVLFAVSRYWTIVNLVIHNVVLALSSPPDRLCRVWYFYVVFATAATSLTTTIISQLRIYAMYNCDRKLLMAMGVAVSLSFGLQGPVLLIMVIRAKTFRLPPVYTGCFAADPYPYLLPYWVQWMPYLTYECFIFVLAIYKSVALARDQPETPWLIYVLLRDSIVFFGGTLSIVLVNCLINALGKPSIFSACTALYIALYSILGCRMLLNIREAANPWARYDSVLYGIMQNNRTDVSSVEFARNNRPDLEAIELELMSPGSSYTSPGTSRGEALQ